jgi:hypothetical protein
VSFLVSFVRGFSNGLLRRFLCSLRTSVPLPAVGMGRILHGVDLGRLVLRQVPRLGRRMGRAAVVMRSVKLVHQRIESGEASRFFGQCSPFSGCVDPIRHDAAGRGAAIAQGLFLARCQLDRDGSLCATFCGDSVMVTVRAALGPSA